MPRETLAWKIKLLSDGAKYANSRLHAVKADILLLVRYYICMGLKHK